MNIEYFTRKQEIIVNKTQTNYIRDSYLDKLCSKDISLIKLSYNNIGYHNKGFYNEILQ